MGIRNRFILKTALAATLCGLLAGCVDGKPASATPSSQVPQSAASYGASSASAPSSITSDRTSSLISSKTPDSQGPASAPLSAVRQEMRGVWISYLEYERMDFSTAEALRRQAAEMFQNCKTLGLNTVILQVRPFGDAIYPSKLFPWSHLVTGTQGKAPGYDPFAIMIEEAHRQGLAVEAWVNPYRVRLNDKKPASLAPQNPAVLHPDWAPKANGGLYYDPANPAVQTLIVDGVKEILQNYQVEGIHFDDYFYPYPLPKNFPEKIPAGKTADQYRRDNVNTLVRAVYAAVKQVNPNVRFGISPQGNLDNNIQQQYSDVAQWLRQSGYVDYLAPQAYWGFGYVTADGKTHLGFAAVADTFAKLPRAPGVDLYMGLGAYRVGVGDGDPDTKGEWTSGGNLAKMVKVLRQKQYGGFLLYRYEHLFWSKEARMEMEKGNLSALLR